MMREYPKIGNFCINGNNIYITDREYNFIGVLDKDSDVVDLKCVINEEEHFKSWLFGEFFVFDNTIFIPPLKASKLYMINENEDCVKSLDFLEDEIVRDVKVGFSHAHLYGDSIFLIPTCYPAIVEINLKSKDIQFFDSWKDAVDQIGRKDEIAYFSRTILHKNIIYAPLCKTNKVLKFYLNNRTWEIVTVDDQDVGYCDICSDGKVFWLLPRMGNRITWWNENDKQCGYIEGIWDEKIHLEQIEWWNNKLWIVPMTRGSVAVIEDGSTVKDAGIVGSNCVIRIHEDAMYISTCEDGVLYRMDKKGVSQRKLKLSTKIVNCYNYYASEIHSYLKGKTSNSLFNETEINSLENFIKGVLKMS